MKIIWMKQRWQSQFPSRFMNINQIQINNEIHIFYNYQLYLQKFLLTFAEEK